MNYRGSKTVALKILDYHGGMSSGCYSVGSCWFAGASVPLLSIQRAIIELEDHLDWVKENDLIDDDKDAQLEELPYLINHLKGLIPKEEVN